jgi:hypothetical protein
MNTEIARRAVVENLTTAENRPPYSFMNTPAPIPIGRDIREVRPMRSRVPRM